MNGMIDQYDLSAANVHDLHYLQDVRHQKANCHIIGDKAYDAIPTQLSLFEQHTIRLLAPARAYKNRYQNFPKSAVRIRKRIETTFSQLCDQFNIKRNYAKSFLGLAARSVRKIAAFSLLQYINVIINHRPQNQIKHARA
ncbi:transposase [Pedobacter sp. HMF7056]|uniref:Transposase n=2 Tax=Hufsiella ginkgonis TaxID=2695274 RepID=A0A7K1Y008_9SPHI|nr:transposase [Hufsiella ginkgonis]